MSPRSSASPTNCKGGGDRVQNLAIALDVKPRPLYRVLRVLAGEGIFKEDPNEHFSLTSMGRLLCDDAPDSLRSYIVMNHEITYPVLNDLMHSLSDDEPILIRTFGQPIFEYLDDHPDRFALFQAAMTAANHAWDPMIAEAYDFSEADRVIDVGGGNGSMLSAILSRHRNVTGVLFDREGAIAAARDGAGGPLPRCEFVVGDFFDNVPRGGDIHTLRRIIHDWADDQAVAILRNCREALAEDGRVIVIETVMAAANESSWANLQDITMLATTHGMERTEQEYGSLMSRAGLRLENVLNTSSDLSLLVGVRA